MKSLISLRTQLLPLFAFLLLPLSALEKKPNVLFIAVDDLNDWIAPLGGHPQTITPNFTRLADSGVLFTNAHCPGAACNPSRTAIMTGLSPHISGLYENGQKMREVLPDAKIGYGENWANVSNTPFREYKHWVHEGGISTPLIAHWPKGITAKNTWAKDPTHLIDLMATCLDLGKATYPADKIPVEGTSLTPIFKGQKIKRGKPLYWEHEGNRAVRDGDWKLVAKSVKGKWELYHIPADRTEMNNLAEKHPDRVKTMSTQYDQWAKERGVVPFNSWKKNKKNKGASKGSDKKIFNLKPGDTFTPETSPAVVNRPFTVTAQLASFPATGVIAAQGGTNHGWSLYLKEGKLHCTVRRGGKEVTGSMKLRENLSGYFAAAIREDGIRLDMGGEPHHSQFFEGNALLTTQPLDVLELAQDTGGLVGDYEKDFKLTVPLKSLKIQLK